MFKSDFSSLLYSAYLGGRESDTGNAIAVDGDGNAYITGWTTSTNYPTVVSTNLPPFTNIGTAFRDVRDGTNDAFVTKIILDASESVPPLFAEPRNSDD